MKSSVFGKLKTGEEVKVFTVANGKTELSVSEYGAAVTKLCYDGKDVVIGCADLDEYLASGGAFGGTIGRFAGRIAGASFSLGGKRFSLDKNDGNNTLDGGFCGFDKVLFKGSYFDGSLNFEYLSRDGEGGFPGNLFVTVRFIVLSDGLRIEYLAKSDKDTPINLTNSLYFNLNGGKRSIDEHTLCLQADAFMPVDAELLPTGEMRPVKATAYDLTKPKKLGDVFTSADGQVRLSGGVDHYFSVKGDGFKKFAELYSPETKLTMDCYTDLPAVQVYTGNAIRMCKMKGGRQIDRHYAVCFKTQFLPESVRSQDMKKPVLMAGELFSTSTEFRFR